MRHCKVALNHNSLFSKLSCPDHTQRNRQRSGDHHRADMLTQQHGCQAQPKERLQQLQLADGCNAAKRQAVIPEENPEQRAARRQKSALAVLAILVVGESGRGRFRDGARHQRFGER